MAQSRSKKETEEAKHFAGDTQAAKAFSKMSSGDRGRVNAPIVLLRENDVEQRNEAIRNLAGAPGAYTTKPGGDIKNSHEESSELRSGNVNQTKLLHELEESNRPKKPKKK